MGRVRLCSATSKVLLTLEGFEGHYMIVGPVLMISTTGELHMKILEEWARWNGLPDRSIYTDQSGHGYLPGDPRDPAVSSACVPRPASDASVDVECMAVGGASRKRNPDSDELPGSPRKSKRLAGRSTTSTRGPYYAC